MTLFFDKILLESRWGLSCWIYGRIMKTVPHNGVIHTRSVAPSLFLSPSLIPGPGQPLPTLFVAARPGDGALARKTT